MTRIGVSFAEPQLSWLTAEAKRLGITIGELLRRIVDQARTTASPDFLPPQPPMGAEQARNLGRTLKAMADQLRLHGDHGGARLSDEGSARWLAYADRADGRSGTDTAP